MPLFHSSSPYHHDTKKKRPVSSSYAEQCTYTLPLSPSLLPSLYNSCQVTHFLENPTPPLKPLSLPFPPFLLRCPPSCVAVRRLLRVGVAPRILRRSPRIFTPRFDGAEAFSSPSPSSSEISRGAEHLRLLEDHVISALLRAFVSLIFQAPLVPGNLLPRLLHYAILCTVRLHWQEQILNVLLCCSPSPQSNTSTLTRNAFAHTQRGRYPVHGRLFHRPVEAQHGSPCALVVVCTSTTLHAPPLLSFLFALPCFFPSYLLSCLALAGQSPPRPSLSGEPAM